MRGGPGEAARAEVAVTEASPPPSRWTLRTIRASVAEWQTYSLSGVWRALHGYDLRLRSARVQHYSPDPQYAAKTATLYGYLREAAQAPDAIVLLFLDEMAYHAWPDPAPTWAPTAPTEPPVAARADPNNRQQRLIGVLNALSGRVDYLDNYIVGRAKVIEMYARIETVYPEARRIYVVQDNWSIHRHADVEAAMDRWPRIERVWLPTYAPWLNPIEKLWRWLRCAVLKMHRLADAWPTLRARVNAFLDQFADGSSDLLRYVGLLGEGQLAQARRAA